MSMMTNPTSQLKELMEKPGVIKILGAHDVLTALLVEKSGIPGILCNLVLSIKVKSVKFILTMEVS